MAGADWAVLAAGLGGTVLGAGLQWAQAAAQARRERRREQQGWTREDRRLWADQRRRIYLATVNSARRQLLALTVGSDRWALFDKFTSPDVESDTRSPSERWPDEIPPQLDMRERIARILDGPEAEWNQRLVEVEFYGSDEVREAVERLNDHLDVLELVPPEGEPTKGFRSMAVEAYADCVGRMRHDLGLSEGRRARFRVRPRLADLTDARKTDA